MGFSVTTADIFSTYGHSLKVFPVCPFPFFFFSWQLQYLCFFSSFQWGPHQSHIQLVTISRTPMTKLLFPACFVIGPSENFFTFHTWYIVVGAVGSESKNLSYLKSCGYFQIIICSSQLYFPFLKGGCFYSYQSEGEKKTCFYWCRKKERGRYLLVEVGLSV